jgi:7-keto-8-aminopelargonate synthetase-like enzyme
MTEPEPLQQVERTYVRFGGRKLSYFSGCDYFRLASHPEVISALKEGVEKFGLNVAASRLTTGNHVLYQRLEEKLAAFFGVQSALLVPGGYVTNLIVAQALAGSFSHAILDEKAHPSLWDAARMMECPVMKIRHRDAEDLKEVVRRCGPGARLMLLTDGMFAHDGSVAPLSRYLQILPTDAVILVDDAHGAGVVGKTGKGSVEHEVVGRKQIIQTITLSKAFGTYGGAIFASGSLRARIVDSSKMFLGSTPLPLPLANAAMRSVKILKSDRSLPRRLIANVKFVKEALCAKGKLSEVTPGPIVPIVPRSARDATQMRQELLRTGIYPPFVKYATGPANGYFRFVISSEHSRKQLESLVSALSVRKKEPADSCERRGLKNHHP